MYFSKSSNRFSTLYDTAHIHSAFMALEELRINRTMISCADMLKITSVLPRLRYLEHGYNALKNLNNYDTASSTYTTPGDTSSKLEILNLDCNELEDWSDIMVAVSPFSLLVGFTWSLSDPTLTDK